ncbi:MurR/RpiR family transcriptional regulator [Psychromarinibacter sp. C21-152]|uniref:MurR/RpiR family transcriptional regulator n=1 Tax=Psychromarinibacter sediminicola TaxID=3033385 RepID=A0AAE3TCE3_9RHOB|nr:MurR/RpiR family transcriptional regulator [Psychromarinibacter sediminicola]MDF0603550.1 MurR/RpiR family transcriptional regulator [Psychromarinibacter sediminicola]
MSVAPGIDEGPAPHAPARPDIIGEIKDRYSGLRPAEQAVADAVLADVREAVRASNGDIAARAGVSQPTVTRFCRSIGCEGVRDFKLQLAQSLAVGEAFLAQDETEVAPGELPPFWTSVLGEARAAIREVERQVSPDDVLDAARALAAAARIATFGVGGSSAALALEAQVRLFRYGLAVDVCSEPYVARMTAATLKPGDQMLVISATGRTPEVIEAVEIANRYGAGSIAITRPGSPLADVAQIALTAEIGEYPDALTPTASRFAFLAILDVVAAATGYRLGPTARESLRRIKFNMLDTRPADGLEPLGD